MKRVHRLFIFSLSGALGGVIAALLHQYFFVDTLATALRLPTRYLYLVALGGVIGLSIGFFPTFVEGRGNYSWRGALRSGMTGAILGGLSGAVALPLAEWLHLTLGGGMTGRVLGWVLFGSFVGVFVGIAEGRVGGARPWRGMFGGVIGGAFAGAVLEWLLSGYVQSTAATLHTPAGESLNPPLAANNTAIWALLLLGLFVALSIALFVNILSDAWLEGQPGSKVQGYIYHLGKFREPLQALIGSDKTKAVFIHIADAEAVHAGITLTRRGALLRHLGQSSVTRVNGMSVSERMLSEGEIIEIGNARLKYRERRKMSTAPASLPGKMPGG